MALLALALALVVAPAPTACDVHSPVPGPVVNGFEPVGLYAGHWGVDLLAESGTPVTAALDGVVSFAGSIAGRRSVTVAHAGGLRTSYSYLATIDATVGDRVAAGDALGTTGAEHGGTLHFSVRVFDRYVDPAELLSCRYLADPSGGLWLA